MSRSLIRIVDACPVERLVVDAAGTAWVVRISGQGIEARRYRMRRRRGRRFTSWNDLLRNLMTAGTGPGGVQ